MFLAAGLPQRRNRDRVIVYLLEFCGVCGFSRARHESESSIKCHKGILWMPWRVEAMKDVVRCDKLRGVANKL